jgi:hypothetical protein
MKIGKRSLIAGTAAIVAFAMSTVLFAPAAGADDEKVKYEGSKTCKKCHIQTFKSWEDTPHGTAFDTLKPNEKAEVKTAAGLDPEKDYTTDPSCLKCHTVGYGEPGGYSIPDPEDKRAMRKAKALQNVGCECCHGPGGAYVDLHEEIMKEQREYTEEEMLAAGLKIPDEQTCLSCHNDGSPTHAQAKPWDYKERLKEGMHEKVELKLRKE